MMRVVRIVILSSTIVAAWLSLARANEETLRLLPGDFTLTGPKARQSLLAENFRGDQATGHATEGLTLESSDPAVVRIENGVAIPAADGTATLTAKVGDRSASVKVMVADFAKDFTWSFRNHVESVFSKASCNGGACHGALAGKKGFKLSLGAFDPQADYFYVTRQARARRVVLSDPGRSLLLEKPTGAVPHKGGIRFAVDSPEYQVIAEWIAAGAPGPQDSDARLTKLEMLPEAAVLAADSKQPLIVRAHFSDGHTEDVTRWAKFTSTDESVASVDDGGLVTVSGQGEAAIKAWYLSWNVIGTVSVPYQQEVDPSLFASAPRVNFIDELALEKLAGLNLPPSPPATDAEFLRRVYLDTIGTLPTADEAKAYLAEASPDKRARLIDDLLARPEFVDYWAYKWSDLLLVNSEKLAPPAMWSYYRWIRNQVAANTPWNEFARQIVTATGSTLENGAANFFVLHQDPPDLAETTSVAFLGMSINCAKCHNHPLEKWTNDQYYGMASLFARVRSKEANGTGNRVVYPVTSGEWMQPRTGKPQPPTPLDGESVAFDAEADRRAHLAKWLTSPENPYFTRAITNRVWANFFGVGLVESVDDLRLTNPPSNEKLLAAAADYLVEQKYDLKSLMRAILQSNTYARSSQPLPGNMADTRFYSRYYPRRMMAEVLLDALSQATGSETKFSGYAPGTRAIELPDVNVASYFLQSFGRPERELTCECERTAEPSMVQVLHLSNGDTLNQKLEAKDNGLSKLLDANRSDAEIIDEAYLAALARYPTEVEKSRLVAALAEVGADRRLLIEDLYWSVLSSKEFLFNH